MDAWPLLGALSILVVASAGAAQSAEDPGQAQQARRLVRRFELPAEARAAVRELMATGAAAVAPLHMALRDPRPEVVQWALFACSGLPGGLEPLREPVRALMASKHLGTALAAARAWSALDGKGQTLVADYHRNTILDVDAEGRVTEHGDLPMVMGATLLPDGHLLAAVYEKHAVVEFDAHGREVWSYRELLNPSHAERLPNGNTLIADSGNRRAVEVTKSGEVAWLHDADVRPIDVERSATAIR